MAALKKYSLLYLGLSVIFIIVNFVVNKSHEKIFIDGDGSGYYAYLPTVFIYKSVDFDSVFTYEKSKRPAEYIGHNYQKREDILINKFTSGTALLQLPFFLMGLLLSIIFGLSTDGYNFIFQYSIAFATLFWVGIGIIYFVKLLVLFGIKRKFAWGASGLMLLSTNLFVFTFVTPSFSHAYSFSIITIFLFFVRKVFIKYNKHDLYKAAFLLGLIVLIRPANLIVIAIIPFMAGTLQVFYDTLKKFFSTIDVFIVVLMFIIGFSPQLVINFLQTGSLLLYGYTNEGFNFLNPHVIDFLFSYKKGWLIYSPIFILLLLAIISLWRNQSRYAFLTFVFFIIIQIYIFSSWWNWYYGDGFGMRPMVDFYGLFMLVIALFLYNVKISWIKVLLSVFILLTIMLNLIQSYQYDRGIIHVDSMSKDSYWYVFLETDDKFENIISDGDETFFGKLSDEPFFATYNYVDSYDEGWTRSNNPDGEFAFSDLLSDKHTSSNIYSPSFTIIIEDSLVGYNNIFVRFETRYLEKDTNSAINSLFVIDISDFDGVNVFYKAFHIKALPNNAIDEWQLENIGFNIPKISSNMASMKFYIWNSDNQIYYIDDLSIKLYTYSNELNN
jgi:hypothetical protein